MTALCCLIIFSISASYLNGDSKDGGATNTNSDCGFKDSSPNADYTGGAALGLAVVGFFLAIVQAVVFFLASRSDASA
jgi:hypothetical protein